LNQAMEVRILLPELTRLDAIKEQGRLSLGRVSGWASLGTAVQAGD
jgi:hypothetical protein